MNELLGENNRTFWKGERVRVNEREQRKGGNYLNGAGAGFPAVSLERAFLSPSESTWESEQSAPRSSDDDSFAVRCSSVEVDSYGGVERKE